MIDALLRSHVRRALSRLDVGRLRLSDAGHTDEFGGRVRPELEAHVTIHAPAAYRRLATGGSLGAAEAYLRGEWSADDLMSAIRIFAANLDAASRLESPLARLASLGATLAHRRRRNSRAGSRRNIRDHYDLGNDFFALFLDETMTYSCGLFEHAGASMKDASVAKLDRVCRALDLSPSDRVVEIGSGWGSFAIHAASRYGCRVTTTTISRAQFDEVARRVNAAGLSDRVTVLLRDYRDLTGTFDKLVSIEMIEAVGLPFLGDYFAACSRLLTSDGQMLLQGIVLPEYRFAPYARSADFIQRYVFPGGALTSVGAIAAALAARTDFAIDRVEDFSAHYARTVRLWRLRFVQHLDEVRALGYDERFLRVWEYYLAYCEAAFLERATGLVQMRLTKPGYRCALPGSGRAEAGRPVEIVA